MQQNVREIINVIYNIFAWNEIPFLKLDKCYIINLMFIGLRIIVITKAPKNQLDVT